MRTEKERKAATAKIYNLQALAITFENFAKVIKKLGLEFFLDPEFTKVHQIFNETKSEHAEVRGSHIVEHGDEIVAKIKDASSKGRRWEDAYNDSETNLAEACRSFMKQMEECNNDLLLGNNQ